MANCPHGVPTSSNVVCATCHLLSLVPPKAELVAIRALIAACEPIAWTKRPGEPENLKPYWSFVATDLVDAARNELDTL